MPVHGDQILRANEIVDTFRVRGIALFPNGRTDLIRLAAEFGLPYVTHTDCVGRMTAPRGASGLANKVSIAFPFLFVLRARDRGIASAAATVRAAIDHGLAFYEHVAATAEPEPVAAVPWITPRDSAT